MDSLQNFYNPTEAKVDGKAENSNGYDPEVHSSTVYFGDFDGFTNVYFGNFDGFTAVYFGNFNCFILMDFGEFSGFCV